MSGWPPGGVRPDRHHGRRHQRDLFGLPGRGGIAPRPPSARCSRCSPTRGCPAASTPTVAATSFHTPEAGGKVAKDQHTQVGRGPPSARSSSTSLPIRPRPAAGSERAFGTLQDRLVKELALAGIATVEAADRFIADTYLPDHNRRFATPPELDDSAFVPLVRPDQVDDILCLHTERIVARDNTVRYERRVLQIPATPARHHYVKARVRVHEYPDGTLALFHVAPMPRPLHRQRRAHRNPNPAGRVRRFDATGRRPVDKWTAAPRLTTSPQGQPQQQKRTYDVLRKPDKSTSLATLCRADLSAAHAPSASPDGAAGGPRWPLSPCMVGQYPNISPRIWIYPGASRISGRYIPVIWVCTLRSPSALRGEGDRGRLAGWYRPDRWVTEWTG